MSANTGHVMNLANSIIGVSVLAMPFCFKQCGITLAILLLILSSITTRMACHFLVKSSSMCKRRNFEFLAFYTFGPSGKLLVELGIIGFMMGTCVAFFVVIGDLGPEIISKIFSVKNDSTLRTGFLLVIGLFVILPLGLLRNIESLAATSTITIGFYFLLITKIFWESFSHLLTGDWIHQVNFWQPQGVLQCIPIFAMALSCQTQIFEIYEALPLPTLDKMNSVVRSAVNMCTIVYISVGLLGYIAFCTRNFTGNILLSFDPSLGSDMYKLGFVMSIAVSFPLVIFPCRASLYSLLFKRIPVHHEISQTSSHIPDFRFKCLTASIVVVSLITGLLIPSIELVLGFVGSTIGVAICVVFPALSFINLTSKETNERITAKITLLIGIMIMVTGSLANFQAATKVRTTETTFAKLPEIQLFPEHPVPGKMVISTESVRAVENKLKDVKTMKLKKKTPERLLMDGKPGIVQSRILNQKKEPPFPVAPAQEITPSQKPVISPPAPQMLSSKGIEDKILKAGAKVPNISINMAQSNVKSFENNINKDAIEKEEREIQQIEQDKKNDEKQKQQELLQKLKEHEKEQKKLLQEQQKILIEMKNRELEKNKVEKSSGNVNKPLVEKLNPIQPEEFNKNVEKVENVKNNLIINQNVIEKEKRNDKVNIVEKSSDRKKSDLIDDSAAVPKPVLDVVKDKELKNEPLKVKVAPVPLPLAKLQSNVQSGAENKMKQDLKSKQEVMRRDILQDSKQKSILIREKRDVDVPAENAASETINLPKSDECTIEEKQTALPKLNVDNKTENVSHDSSGSDKIIEKTATSGEGTANPDVIIKNLHHISVGIHIDKELTLEQKPIIISQNPQLSIPKKRDLKSFTLNRKKDDVATGTDFRILLS